MSRQGMGGAMAPRDGALLSPAQSAKSEARLHYMDALRGVLMSLGILLHSANIFSPKEWAIQNVETSFLFGVLVEFVHQFRMPAFFIISGFFCHLTLSRYGSKKFLNIRLQRIAIPFIATALLFNTTQVLVLQAYDGQALNFNFFADWRYWLEGDFLSHLWFLACLFVYFLLAASLWLLAPLAVAKLGRLVQQLIQLTGELYLYVVPLVIFVCTIISVKVSVSMLGDSAWAAAVIETLHYSCYFIFGLYIGFHRQVLDNFSRPSLAFVFFALFVAVFYFSVRYFGESNANAVMLSRILESYFPWILSAFCFYFFMRFFDKPSRVFLYFSEASYSLYLFHHLLVIVLGILVIPLHIPVVLKFFLVVSLTFTIALAMHHFIVLKHPLIRLMFNGKRG